MEVDVVSMTTQLLHGGENAAGAMTSGGTESIIMASKTARDRARQERGVTRPQMLFPTLLIPPSPKRALTSTSSQFKSHCATTTALTQTPPRISSPTRR